MEDSDTQILFTHPRRRLHRRLRHEDSRIQNLMRDDSDPLIPLDTWLRRAASCRLV